MIAAALAAFGAHVGRFWWLCDDAFISFRYARNLAHGAGPVFNVGETPPVEGYTNFLWVLLLAPFEAWGAPTPLVAAGASALCGLALVVVLGRLVLARTGDSWAQAFVLTFVVSLPPLACWSTSGLETMPYTLALFGTFAALNGRRAHVAWAALAAVAAVLLRADGALFVALVTGVSLAVALARKDRARARGVWIVGVVAMLATLAHVLWRHSYYGAWEPNTARAKVELSSMVVVRGFNYLATFAITFPSTLLAFGLAAARWPKSRDPLVLSSLAVVLAVGAFALAVGGDFMAMGRFLVPMLPFLALAFGLTLARLPRPLAAGITLACAAAALPVVLGGELFPASLRQRFEFRYSSEDMPGEFEQWHKMRQQAARWAALGRALARHTRPGESLMIGTVGAIGYYSGLTLHDPFGLVSREEFAPSPADAKRSPGHQRRIPYATLLTKNPTYLDAFLVPRNAPQAALREVFQPGGELNRVCVPEFYDASGIPGCPPGQLLRVMRYAPRRQ